jgi:cobalt-zinc-cadmium efflux system membrane fusion protein
MRRVMMRQAMRTKLGLLGLLLGLLLVACGGSGSESSHLDAAVHPEESTPQAVGPHGGRLFRSGEFALELALVERDTPPEFRVWVTNRGQAVAAAEVTLELELARLGGRVDSVVFVPEDEFSRSERTVAEPHSFEVSIEATYRGESYTWDYETFEGRTTIGAEVAQGLGVKTETVGPADLKETVTVYGRIRVNPSRVRELRARFDGVVRGVYAEVGSSVQRGAKLLRVESDESLNPYSVLAPISGIVTQRDANPGEQTNGRLLLTITDTSSVWADLSVFPGDRARVRVGSPVSIAPATGGEPVSGVVSTLEVLASANQSVVARAVLDNPAGRLLPGTFVTADVTIGEYSVPLAVRRTGIQTSRGSSVVYVQVGEEYEARPLELGREAGAYVEVLSGLQPDTRYVSENSYVIRADIEKSGASHDH